MQSPIIEQDIMFGAVQIPTPTSVVQMCVGGCPMCGSIESLRAVVESKHTPQPIWDGVVRVRIQRMQCIKCTVVIDIEQHKGMSIIPDLTKVTYNRGI